MRKIILHIGSPKCGSTYLQQVMLRNTTSLAAHKVRYPHDGFGHPGNAADLATITRAQLEEDFSGDTETVFYSHEDLYAMPKRGDALSALAAEMEISVQVIAFIRPFSEFVFGDYSQFMKQHFDTYLKTRNPYDGKTLEEFAERRIQHLTPAAYLANWSKRFPGTKLILESHRNIRPVLENLLGAEAIAEWTVPSTQVNRSLRIEDCERIAQAMTRSGVSDARLHDMLREAFKNTDLPDAGRSRERTLWLEAQFDRQNNALMERFGFNNRLAPPAD